MAQKGLIEQAMLDAKSVKEAAYRNAKTVIVEQLKDNIKEFVDQKLNEEEAPANMKEEEETYGESEEPVTEADETVKEGDDLDLGEEEDDADLDLALGGEEEDEDVEMEGLGLSDMNEALDLALLDEVTHGALGELEKISDPETKHDTGLMDQDQKEDGWDKKKVPAAKDWTVKESAYRSKIKTLAMEVVQLRKALGITKKALSETNLFNAKMFYSNKLMNKTSSIPMKKKILETMDKAKTISEAKNLHDSLDTALGLVSESKKPAKKVQKSTLAEATGLQIPASSGKGVTEVDLSTAQRGGSSAYDVERMKRLAGITKEE